MFFSGDVAAQVEEWFAVLLRQRLLRGRERRGRRPRVERGEEDAADLERGRTLRWDPKFVFSFRSSRWDVTLHR